AVAVGDLVEKLDRLPLRARDEDDLAVGMEERSPKAVAAHQRRPPDLTGLESQAVAVLLPVSQTLSLSGAQAHQRAPMRSLDVPEVLEEVGRVPPAPTPNQLPLNLGTARHPPPPARTPAR